MISTHAIILAAGKGSRMKSELPKVLHLLNKRPMIHYVLDVAKKAGIQDVVVVVGYKRPLVIDAVNTWQEKNFEMNIQFAVQEEQFGTGHAVQCGQSFLPAKDASILVLLGDVPLLQVQTIQKTIEKLHNESSAAVVVSTKLENPTGYGRIVKEKDTEQKVFAIQKIIEEKDATDKQRKIKEVNTGIFAFDAEKLWQYLNLLNSNNSQNELYLTDMVEIFKNHNEKVQACLFQNSSQFEGVNSLEQLANLERRMELAK